MESTSTLRQSASVSSRLSAIDVSQLDKINAIPNKTKNNVLTDGLCHEDRLYLEALMDEESLDSDEDPTPNLTDHGGSPWSPPMAGRPMMNSKRIKRLKRSSYTITMSLEDISYIRPSWGMSKGLKRIELVKDKRKRKKPTSSQTKSDTPANKKSSTVSCSNTEPGSDKQASNQQEVGGNEKSITVSAYHFLLGFLVLVLISLMIFSYLVEARRRQEKVLHSRLEFSANERSFKIMKLEDGNLVRLGAFQVNYGRGIPKNLRHDECNCETFEAETRRLHQAFDDLYQLNLSRTQRTRRDNCFACFDWSHRGNLQVFINKSRSLTGLEVYGWPPNQRRRTQPLISSDEDQSITCYDIKWQSYDSLRTPIVDCFHIHDNDQWLGLGDIQSPAGFLNKIDQLVATPILSNISSEFFRPNSPPPNEMNQANGSSQSSSKYVRELTFGSHVDLQFLTWSGFFVGNVRTDFERAVRISAERREVCLTVSCNERCHRVWSKSDDVNRFRYQNNLLEYSICSASNLKVLVAQLVGERSVRFAHSSHSAIQSARLMSPNHPTGSQVVEQLEVEPQSTPISSLSPQEQRSGGPSTPEGVAPNLLLHPLQPTSSSSTTATKRQLDGMGLLEGTIFVTDSAFIEPLDGKTLRHHADKIVKLDLKTKPILVLDTRWQLYLGSFQINSAHFPKAKLLFEILHNKGFKLVLTVKPYVDATIGVASLTQLLDSGRIVSAKYQQRSMIHDAEADDEGPSSLSAKKDVSSSKHEQLHGHVIFRRKSFFHYKNETIYLGDDSDPIDKAGNLRAPYLFECKESHASHCALIDLAQARNRLWLIDLIKRSNFLAQESDGILFAGAHPNPAEWDETYRNATSLLIDQLTYKENLFVIPQWTGNFNYIQLAPRARDWNGLKSTLSSVLTLSALGFALVHPGSVWGDLRIEKQSAGDPKGTTQPLDEEERNRAEEELIVRWLQLAIFLPILQFNDLEPVYKFNLQDQMQQLIKLRKLHVAPEIKRNLPSNPFVTTAPMVTQPGEIAAQQPALRQIVWSSSLSSSAPPSNSLNLAMQQSSANSSGSFQTQSNHQQAFQQAAEALSQQFMIGPDLLVAPVLNARQRQKDIYLPTGYWHDELRQTNVRGGKWLRNYPVELNEIAWFVRARR